jgi:Uma2 family endonuclease
LNAYRLPLDTAVMADVERRQFTVAEFARMGEIGIFSEQERVELLAGEVIRMNPVGARHVVVNQLNDLFHRLLGETAIVSMQTPVVLDEDNQPLPDLAFLRPRSTNTPARRPSTMATEWRAPGDASGVPSCSGTRGIVFPRIARQQASLCTAP